VQGCGVGVIWRGVWGCRLSFFGGAAFLYVGLYSVFFPYEFFRVSFTAVTGDPTANDAANITAGNMRKMYALHSSLHSWHSTSICFCKFKMLAVGAADIC